MRCFKRLHARKALLVLTGLLLAGWLIPPFFHAGRYRKILQATLESRLGRPVELGTITLRLVPHPGFSIRNVVVEEAPQFGSEPFARVDRVECDLGWRSLLGSRLDCSQIVLDHPVLNVVRNAAGDWNIEDIFHQGSAATKPSFAGAVRHPALPFDFEAEDAHINFTLDGTKRPFALDGADARFEFNPSRGSVRFRIQCTPVRTDVTLLQPPGQVVMSGKWKPAAGFSGPFQARLTTSNSLLYEWIPLIARRDPGIYGLVSANIRFGGSIQRIRMDGKVRINQLHRWESSPTTAPAPVNLNFSAFWDQAQDRLRILKANAAFSGSRLRLTGVVDHVARAPNLHLVLSVTQSSLADLIRMGNNLARHPASWSAFGRVNGMVTLQGPWTGRRYGGSLSLRRVTLKSHGIELSARAAEIRIDGRGAHLLPAEVVLGPGVEGVMKGNLFPVLPGRYARVVASRARKARRTEPTASHYELILALKKIPLHSVIRLARSEGVQGLRDLDATGTGNASIRLSGSAWPFVRPIMSAQGHLNSARLLVAGLTEPVRLARFQFELKNGAFIATPWDAAIGATTFTGWLKRGSAPDSRWRFSARTRWLSLEQASLWFAVLGYRRPMPILDLIPGLRSLEGRRRAGRNLFATLNAQGRLECSEVTFRSLTLSDFHAGVTLSGRIARISGAAFRVASGKGNGSAEINFKQAPAVIAGQFRLAGVRLERFASRLPIALSGVRGALSAAGRFTTRGLTPREMAANLVGRAHVRLRRVGLGRFDPLEAAARVASLGALAPSRRPVVMPRVNLDLSVSRGNISLVPARINLSGATLRIEGNYGSNGIAGFVVQADLTHLKRRWLNDPRPAALGNRMVTLRFGGPLKKLAVVPGQETAGTHPQIAHPRASALNMR